MRLHTRTFTDLCISRTHTHTRTESLAWLIQALSKQKLDWQFQKLQPKETVKNRFSLLCPKSKGSGKKPSNEKLKIYQKKTAKSYLSNQLLQTIYVKIKYFSITPAYIKKKSRKKKAGCCLRREQSRSEREGEREKERERGKETRRGRNTTYLLLLQMQQLDCAYFAARVTSAWSPISTASL